MKQKVSDRIGWHKCLWIQMPASSDSPSVQIGSLRPKNFRRQIRKNL